MDRNQELQTLVNPVFHLALPCLHFESRNGDEDSRQLLELFDFDMYRDAVENHQASPDEMEEAALFDPVFSVNIGTRFRGMNHLIESRPDAAVVDLPCVCTSRAIKLARHDRTYYGFDLPAVIGKIEPAVRKLIGEQENIRYCEVDATNYSSMEKPLGEEKKELLIVTEGLLMYLSQSELEEVFANIRRLLQNHGGSWILSDHAYFTHDLEIAKAVLSDAPETMDRYINLMSGGEMSIPEIETYENVFFQNNGKNIWSFINAMGFEASLVGMADYVPDMFEELSLSSEKEAAVRQVLEDMYFLELKVKPEAEKNADKVFPFRLDSSFEDGVFRVSVRGRLDTITAPELLMLFQNLPSVPEEIDVDAENMTYISSAGLRALLVMYKALKDRKRFRLRNINHVVRGILAASGFDQYFL